MTKTKTSYGYDILELTKEECKKRDYSFPTFAIFVSGENYETVGLEECSVGSFNEALAWCKEYNLKRIDEKLPF